MSEGAEKPIYIRLAPNGELPEFPDSSPSKVVVILDGNYNQEWQDRCSQWMVAGGCRYMMAWGPNCSSWDDSVDHADVERFDFGEIPDTHFVMTTWHDDETLEEVFWFSQYCATLTYDDVEISTIILLHIGSADRAEEFAQLFEQSRSLADREEPEPQRGNWFRRLIRR